MTYKKIVKQRRAELRCRLDIDKPPLPYLPQITDPAGSVFEVTEADRLLIESGDHEAMRLRLVQLEKRISELNVAGNAKLEEAKQYHSAALNAHKRLDRLFQEQTFDEFLARNKIGEFLCAAFIHYVLGFRDGSVEYDSMIFQTPLGKRRIDAYMPERRLAVESKMGCQSLTKRVHGEIEKDEYLLSTGKLRNVYWIFYAKSSAPLLKRLRRSPIIVATDWLTADIKSRVFGHSLPPWLPI
jgi:hypothetical protein